MVWELLVQKFKGCVSILRENVHVCVIYKQHRTCDRLQMSNDNGAQVQNGKIRHGKAENNQQLARPDVKIISAAPPVTYLSSKLHKLSFLFVSSSGSLISSTYLLLERTKTRWLCVFERGQATISSVWITYKGHNTRRPFYPRQLVRIHRIC